MSPDPDPPPVVGRAGRLRYDKESKVIRAEANVSRLTPEEVADMADLLEYATEFASTECTCGPHTDPENPCHNCQSGAGFYNELDPEDVVRLFSTIRALEAERDALAEMLDWLRDANHEGLRQIHPMKAGDNPFYKGAYQGMENDRVLIARAKAELEKERNNG